MKCQMLKSAKILDLRALQTCLNNLLSTHLKVRCEKNQRAINALSLTLALLTQNLLDLQTRQSF